MVWFMMDFTNACAHFPFAINISYFLITGCWNSTVKHLHVKKKGEEEEEEYVLSWLT
jgi:hypothetical protein